jgi:hypothetical protein
MPDVNIQGGPEGLRRRDLLLRAGGIVVALGVLDPMSAFAAAPSRYVTATGNDARDGLSPATAWRSVSKAIVAAPGGAIVNIGPGTFPATATNIRKPTLTVLRRDPAYAGQSMPSLAGLRLDGCENLRFEDLALGGPTTLSGACRGLQFAGLQHVGNEAVNVYVDCAGGSNLLWERCVWRDARWEPGPGEEYGPTAVQFAWFAIPAPTDITFRGNLWRNLDGFDGVQFGPTSAEGRYVNIVLEDNEWDRVNPGVMPDGKPRTRAHSDAIQAIGWSTGIVLRRNFFHHGRGLYIGPNRGSSPGLHDLDPYPRGWHENLLFENNVFSNDVFLPPFDHFAVRLDGNCPSPTFVNNTVDYGSSRTARGIDLIWRRAYSPDPQTNNVTLQNNVVKQLQVIGPVTFAAGRKGYNLLAKRSGYALGPGDRAVAAKYVNPGALDYRPAKGSPSIDTGTIGAHIPQRDKAGRARVGRTDIGAFEYVP